VHPREFPPFYARGAFAETILNRVIKNAKPDYRSVPGDCLPRSDALGSLPDLSKLGHNSLDCLALVAACGWGHWRTCWRRIRGVGGLWILSRWVARCHRRAVGCTTGARAPEIAEQSIDVDGWGAGHGLARLRVPCRRRRRRSSTGNRGAGLSTRVGGQHLL
jgi:hypothetical protein